MNDMTIFNYEGNEVEIFELKGEVFLNPYHVGACLGMVGSTVLNHLAAMNENQAVLLKNSDIRLTDIRKLNNAGEKFLTESGVYKLMFKSRKPEAEKFQDWVTDEVLPTIRKTGKYETPKKAKEVKANLPSVNNAVKIIGQFMKQAGVGEDIQLLTVKGLYAKADIFLPIDIQADKVYYDTRSIAKRLGMYTKTGKPAYTAVSQIVKQLDIFTDEVKEVWETSGSWQGVVCKYSESVIGKAKEWLIDHGYPTTIAGKSQNYHVVYENAA